MAFNEGRNLSHVINQYCVTNRVMIDWPSLYVIKMAGRYLEGLIWAAEMVNLSMYAFEHLIDSLLRE